MPKNTETFLIFIHAHATDYFNHLVVCARPEPVEGYPRALEEILQQVQNERRKYIGKKH